MLYMENGNFDSSNEKKMMMIMIIILFRQWGGGVWEKNSTSNTYLVTLKILSKRTQRSTDTPNGGITSKQMGKKFSCQLPKND